MREYTNNNYYFCLLLLIINIICFLCLMDPDGYKYSAKTSFATGYLASENQGDELVIVPEPRERHAKLVERIEKDLQSSLDEYHRRNNIDGPQQDFEIHIQHLNGANSAITYHATGDRLFDMLEFFALDAVETRFRMLAPEEFKLAREKYDRSGCVREFRTTLITHLSGYMGLISSSLLLYFYRKYARKPTGLLA